MPWRAQCKIIFFLKIILHTQCDSYIYYNYQNMHADWKRKLLYSLIILEKLVTLSFLYTILFVFFEYSNIIKKKAIEFLLQLLKWFLIRYKSDKKLSTYTRRCKKVYYGMLVLTYWCVNNNFEFWDIVIL